MNNQLRDELDAGAVLEDSYDDQKSEYSSERYEVQHVVKHKKNKAGKVHLLIKWKGYSSAQNTWEPLESFYNDAAPLVNDYFKSKGLELVCKSY